MKVDFSSGKSITEQVQEKRKAEQERAAAEHKRSRDAEEARKSKDDTWMAGKIMLRIPDQDVKFEKIEEITYWRGISGSKFVQLIKFTAPPDVKFRSTKLELFTTACLLARGLFFRSRFRRI